MKNSFRFVSIIVFFLSLLTTAYAHAEQAVTVTKNLNYNSQGQLLDVYVPQARDKQTAIMFIHGGGFKRGSKEDMSFYARIYSQGGFVTSSINYRLTPNHVFPAAINDTRDALQWMKEHADDYGYDVNKIVLVGYSAGATLALNVGLADDTGVAAIVSSAPATDLGVLMLPLPDETPLHKILRHDLTTYMGGQPPRLASPIFQVSDNDPPVFLFHGDKDRFVSVTQSVSLAQKLQQHNVPVLLRVFPGADHEIMIPFEDKNKNLRQSLKEMTDFILVVEKG
jgi:acetyl esterase/lipase